MDPLTSIVMALAAGAAAALKPVAEQVIQDGYAGLKMLIKGRYAKVNMDYLEENPSSKIRREAVKEDLATAGADKDAEILPKAQALLEAIQRHAPEAAAAIGVDLKDIAGAALAIRDVIATGTGVKIEQAKMTGDITIEHVRAGGQEGKPPNL